MGRDSLSCKRHLTNQLSLAISPCSTTCIHHDNHIGLDPEAGHLPAVYGGIAGRGSINMTEILLNEPWSFMDPTAEEYNLVTGLQFTQGNVRNLSPTCFGVWNCRQHDWSLAPQADFGIIFGTVEFNANFVTEANNFTNAEGVQRATGKPYIFLSDRLHHISERCKAEEGDEGCILPSSIDLVARMEELAAFLGYTPPPEMEADKARLCTAVQTFTAATKRASDEGIRSILAAIYPVDDGTTAFLFDRGAGQMATLEQLGLPVLAPGLCGEECAWTASVSSVERLHDYIQFNNCTGRFNECNDDPFYKIDFYILEGGSLRGFVEDRDWVEANWPDKAILAGQFVQSNYGYGIISHRGVANELEEIARQLNAAQRMYPRGPDCVDLDVTTLDIRDSQTLADNYIQPGEYVCHTVEYLRDEYFATCPMETAPPSRAPNVPDGPTVPSDAPTGSPVSEGRMVSSANIILIVVAIVGLALSYLEL